MKTIVQHRSFAIFATLSLTVIHNSNSVQATICHSPKIQTQTKIVATVVSRGGAQKRDCTPAGGDSALKTEILGFIASRTSSTPNFWLKSFYELLLAISLQLAAEYKIRKSFAAMIAASDYILAAVLTACAGKYYSMLRTLKPKTGEELDKERSEGWSEATARALYCLLA